MASDSRVPDDPLLSDLSPTTRFSERAADYVRHRPGYPAAAIDAILRGLGDPVGLVAADVGAGTGIASRLLAERGLRVLAIEPNAEMRAAAAPHPGIEWRDGTGEATGLPDASVALVMCAQAFHWLHAARALAEFRRVLEPGGRLALMWNNRDRDDPFTRAYIEAVHAVNGEHPAERRAFDPACIEAEGGFTPVRLERFANAQELDREGLMGRALSASYVPRTGAAHETLERLLGELFESRRDARGLVTMRYVTQVWLAERQ
jgi:SAM-dependent methyltransferase